MEAQPSDATPTPAPAQPNDATPSADAAPAPAPAAAPKKPAFSKRTKLAQAVRQGQAGRVRLLVEQDMARELKQEHPAAYIAMVRHYLSIAVAEGPDEGIIDYLLSKLPEGTRLNSLSGADREGVESASHLMAAGNSEGATEVGHLLEWKACPVYMAICNGMQEERVLRLLARPDDPADLPLPQEDNNRMLLHQACRKGMLAVVKALVAPPHAVPIVENGDEDGLTPLCLAMQENRPDVVHFLCQQLRQQYGQYGDAKLARCIDFPLDPAIGEGPWSSAYTCLAYDALEALQILLLERPDGDAFFTSRSPNYSKDNTPILMAAYFASLRCLKWLVEEHGALQGSPPPPVLHAVCRGAGVQGDNRLPVLKYLVEDCGMDVEALHDGQTSAEVAKRYGRTELHDVLTRGKRAAAADEAADALLAELKAEAERKAQKQQKKKGKKKRKAATVAMPAREAKAEEQQRAVATVEEAAAQAAALALGGGDEEQEEDEAEANPIEPQPAPASIVMEDLKIPAPQPKPQQAAPRIPESEEAHSSKPAPTTKSSLAPPPPSAAGGDCSPAPAKKAAAAVAEEDPREAAFLLKHARREDICPLSGVLLTDPVIASDGITYARAALEAYVEAVGAAGETLRSPVTGELIAPILFPNVAVRRLVEHYVEAQRAEWRRVGRRPRRC